MLVAGLRTVPPTKSKSNESLISFLAVVFYFCSVGPPLHPKTSSPSFLEGEDCPHPSPRPRDVGEGRDNSPDRAVIPSGVFIARSRPTNTFTIFQSASNP